MVEFSRRADDFEAPPLGFLPLLQIYKSLCDRTASILTHPSVLALPPLQSVALVKYLNDYYLLHFEELLKH